MQNTGEKVIWKNENSFSSFPFVTRVAGGLVEHIIQYMLPPAARTVRDAPGLVRSEMIVIPWCTTTYVLGSSVQPSRPGVSGGKYG